MFPMKTQCKQTEALRLILLQIDPSESTWLVAVPSRACTRLAAKEACGNMQHAVYRFLQCGAQMCYVHHLEQVPQFLG